MTSVKSGRQIRKSASSGVAKTMKRFDMPICGAARPAHLGPSASYFATNLVDPQDLLH